MATDNLNGGNSSTSSNSDSVLKDSPWARLSEVTSLDNVSAGFASATGNQSGGAGAANSSSDSPYGGNPFANFGNPNASGNVFTGGTNPWASLNNSGGGGNTGSSPVGGSDTSSSNPFGGGKTSSSPVASSVTSGGSTSSSGSGNFGDIDFGSASQSVSFQDRIQTDQLVNSSLSQNGVSVPTSNSSFIGTFGGSSPVSGSNSDGGSPVGIGNGSGSSNPFDPGFDPSSSGSNSSSASPVVASPVDGSNSSSATLVSGSNSDGVAQVSPFDQLQQNLDDYFKPFSNGGTPDASQFGDPSKINPFNANLSGSNSSVDGGMPTVGGSTPTVNSTAPVAVDDTPAGNNSVFPQLASNDGSNLAQTSPIADTSNQLVDGSSQNAGDNPSSDDLNKFFSAAQSGDDTLIGSSIPDGTPTFVADAIKGNGATIANTFGQNQNQGGNFIGGNSTDGNSVFSGGSGNTQDYSEQMAYYQGLTSQFQQNPQEANNGLVGDNQFSGGSNPFGGSSSNPFGGGGSPFGA